MQTIARARGITLALLALAAAASFAGEIQVFEHADYRGRSQTLRQAVADLESVGMNDRISSVRVRSGTWQLCTDANFRGQCVSIGPGDYRSVEDSLNDRFSSARELGQATILQGEQMHGRAQAAGGVAILYEGEDLEGAAVEVRASTPNLEAHGFNDRARSIDIRQGTWVLCEHADFRGDCQTLGPGRHPGLDGKVSGRVSSMRLAAGSAPAAFEPAPRWGSGARAVLYEQARYGGRAIVIDSEVVPDFGRSGFNDRALSLRIEAGYWIFCTDAAFHGECRTFGPGEYPALDATLGRRISSGRRIHPQFPYGSAPAWR